MDKEVIDLEMLVKCWGYKDWDDFVKTTKDGFYLAVDVRTGETVRVRRADSASAKADAPGSSPEYK